MRQRAGAIAQQSRTATGVIVQKLDENDGIKDVGLVPVLDEEAASTTGSSGAGGAAGGVAERLRGGGAGTRGLAWMSSVVRDVLYPKAR